MKFNAFTILVISFIIVLSVSDSYANRQKQKNILCILAMASPSHHIWNKALMEGLAIRGHNVTALSITVEKESLPNLHYLELNGLYEALYTGEEPFDLLEFSQKNIVGVTLDMMKYFIKICRASLESRGAKALLEYPDDFHFDLVLFDYTNLPCLHGFVDKFKNPPQIGITAFANPPHTSDLVGSPNFVSLVPFYTTNLGVKMSFWDRLYNSLYYVVEIYQRRLSIWWMNGEAKKVFGEQMPYIGDLESNVELVLVNSHPGMDVPEPLLPTVIPVGGLHIKEPKKLPDNIENFVQSSKKGVVLFSLGTNVKSEVIGEEKIKMFINAISKFPEYNFLWKIELENQTYPKNLMVQKWLPQNDLLGHPKTKLFITHGGLLSSQESTWHAVPILGMPFIVDQYTNVQKSIDAGVGEKIDFLTLTEEVIYEKIKTLLENPSYKKNMRSRSSRFRDRYSHPLEEAIWWCEYVLRHKGAHHLKSRAKVMGLPVLFMWDLLLAWLGILIVVVFATIRVIKMLLCAKQKKIDKQLKNKKNK